MLNSKQMKLATQAAQHIAKNDRVVVFTVRGVIADIKANTHSGSEMIIPAWGQDGTVAAITADEKWDTNPEVLDHLISSVQGRMAHFHIIETTGVDVTAASMEQATIIMSHTDAQQERILQQMVGAVAYLAYKIKQAAEMAQHDASGKTVH